MASGGNPPWDGIAEESGGLPVSIRGFQVRTEDLRSLANKLAKQREKLDKVRRLSREAARFAAPGQDPVSAQVAPLLREVADDGPGSLSFELATGLMAMQRHIEELRAMAAEYERVEEENRRGFDMGFDT